MKICRVCAEAKLLEDFPKEKQNKDGLKSLCKSCFSAYMRNYYQKNPESIKARARQYHELNRDDANRKRRERRKANIQRERLASKRWAAENPEKTRAYKSANNAKRRLRKSAGFVRTQDLVKLQRQTKCFYCQQTKKLTIEHVIPLSRGGQHTIGNLVMACQSCNFRKHAKFIMEWRLYKLVE